jgi:hypothetical protein
MAVRTEIPLFCVAYCGWYFRGTTLKMAAPSSENLCWFTRLRITLRQHKPSVITAVDSTNLVPNTDLFVFNVKNVLWKEFLVLSCAFEHKIKFRFFRAWQLDNGERCYMLSRGDRRPMGSLQDASYTIPFKLIPYILQGLWPYEQFTFSSSVLRYFLYFLKCVRIFCAMF